jgi:hypothetical protein
MAAAAAAIAAEALLAEFPDLDQMLTMCGFTNAMDRARLINYERFASLDAFGDYTDTMIESMADKNEKRSPAANRVLFGIQRVLYVKAVSFWVRKQRREGIPVSIDNLNPDVINQMIQEMNLERSMEAHADEDKVNQPGKFDPKNYVSWARSFENYLDSLRGKSGVPLSYLIRPEDADPLEAIDEYQRTLWSAPLAGTHFREDNRRLYRIYKDLVVGTDAWTWFNRATVGDGRNAHLLLTRHYRGDAEVALRAAEAEADLNRLHYRGNEAVFSFNKYITRMSECFELMEDNQQGLSEPQKVKRMLEGIISTNPELYAIKAVVRTAHPTNFNLASRLMAEQVALLYPSSNKDAGNKRKISAVEQHTPGGRGSGGRDNRNGGQPKGRTGGGGRRGHQQFLNGVDVSDPMRNFTSDEWKRLRESGFLSWIIDRRAGMNSRRAGGGGRGNNRGGRGGGNHGRGGGNQGRGAQVGAVTTNVTEVDASTITDSANANNATATRHVGGNAGLRFGGSRFRNGANASGGQP